jgi:hypothetical protein
MTAPVEHPTDAYRFNRLSPRMLADIALSSRLQSRVHPGDGSVIFARSLLHDGVGTALLNYMRVSSESLELTAEYKRLESKVDSFVRRDVRTCVDEWYDALADQIYECAAQSHSGDILVGSNLYSSFPVEHNAWVRDAGQMLGIVRLIEQRQDEGLVSVPPPQLIYPLRVPASSLRYGSGPPALTLVLGHRVDDIPWSSWLQKVLAWSAPLLDQASIALLPAASADHPFGRVAWSTLEHGRRWGSSATVSEMLDALEDADAIQQYKIWPPVHSQDLRSLTLEEFRSRIAAEGLDRAYDEARRNVMFCNISERAPYVIVDHDVFFLRWNSESERFRQYVAQLSRKP